VGGVDAEIEPQNLYVAPPERRVGGAHAAAQDDAEQAAEAAAQTATPTARMARAGAGAGAGSVAGAPVHEEPSPTELSSSSGEEDAEAPRFRMPRTHGQSARERLEEALALNDAEQERRVSRGLDFAEQGIFNLGDGKPRSMTALHKAARAAQAAVMSGVSPRDARPCAAVPKDLWAAAPRALLFSEQQDAAFAAPPRVAGPKVHPRVDAAVVRDWHRDDGCPDCVAKRPCYIFSLRRNMEALELPFRPGAEPTVKVEPRRARKYDLSSPEGQKVIEVFTDLVDADVLEPVENEDDPDECMCISPAHLAQKQGLAFSAAELDAAQAYDLPRMTALATERAARIVDELVRLSGGQDWTRAMVDTVMASHRDGPIKWRLVVGLHVTVNDLVEDWDFTYADFEEEWAASDHPWTAGDRVSKKDFIKGFYSVEIAQHHRKFFCVRDPRDPTGKRVLRYKRLPMGFKLAPAIYSALTSEVARHLNASEHGRAGALYRFYVDDLAIKAKAGRAEAAHDFASAEAPKAQMPWGAGPGKDERPAQANVITGRLFDSNVGGRPMVRVEASKLYTALVDLEILRLAAEKAPGSARLPGEWLRSMAGRVAWVAQSTYAARLHTASLWYAACHARRSASGMVRLGRISGLADDAAWFTGMAQAGRLRGARYVRADELQPDSVEVVHSDASGDVGAAACWNGLAVYHLWRGSERDMSIQAKELEPIVAAAERFGTEWTGKVVVFYTDNLGNAFGINRGKAVLGAASSRLARLYELADAHGFEFVAVWLPRRFNTAADAISKACSRAEAVAAAMAHGAVPNDESVIEY